jgi:dethiobiotin synthetase
VETVHEEDADGSSYTGSQSRSSYTGSSHTGSSYTGSGTGTRSGSGSGTRSSRTGSRSRSSDTGSRDNIGGGEHDDDDNRPSQTNSFAADSYSGSSSSSDRSEDDTLQQEDSIVSNNRDDDNDNDNDNDNSEEDEEESAYEEASASIRLMPPTNKNTKCKSIAVLGTMSDVGKSTLAAGLCRILSNGGLRVAPFKAQNMSNNASPALLPNPARRTALFESFAAAVGGDSAVLRPSKDHAYGEIGTAQALQAEACRQVPRVEMNPVLLKSGGKNKKGEHMCSVVVLGRQVVTETYGDLGKRTTSLRNMVLDCHEALADATGADAIVIEGAGSCTELNLMNRDIVNLPLVRALNCPWLLVANIDPGGVFAQVVGTKMCVSERDWSMCVGVVINKLRGEAKYFEPGPKMLQVRVAFRMI